MNVTISDWKVEDHLKTEAARAAAMQNPQGNGAKYTPIAIERAEEVLEDAADAVYSIDLGERIGDEAEIEEHEDNPGTWFVSFRAETWREADAVRIPDRAA